MDTYRDIPGFPEVRVSRAGEILSLKTGRVLKATHGRSKGESLGGSGGDYLRVRVLRDGVYKVLRVHRAVALAYILNEDSKPYVDHIDGDKENNAIDNLRWVTAKENAEYKYQRLGKEA